MSDFPKYETTWELLSEFEDRLEEHMKRELDTRFKGYLDERPYDALARVKQYLKNACEFDLTCSTKDGSLIILIYDTQLENIVYKESLEKLIASEFESFDGDHEGDREDRGKFLAELKKLVQKLETLHRTRGV